MWKYFIPVFALGLATMAMAQQQQLGGPTSVAGVTNIPITDCSGTIQTAGAAQQAFGASPNRHGFIIQNIDTTEVMWISMSGIASPGGLGSFYLQATNGSFTAPTGMGINTALSIVAATAGHKFTCTVW